MTSNNPIISINWNKFYKLDNYIEFWKQFRAIEKRAKKYSDNRLREKIKADKENKLRELKSLPLDSVVFYPFGRNNNL